MATARSNSFFLVMYPSAMIVLVRVVPIFAPMMIGIAPSNDIDPEATAATVIEVEVELLWMIAVINNPINNPMKGFDVAKRIDWAMSSPR